MKLESVQQAPSEKYQLTISNFLGTWSSLFILLLNLRTLPTYLVRLQVHLRTVLWKTFRANRNNVRGETKERELPRRGQVLTLKWLSTSKRTIYRRFVTMTNYGIIPPSTIKSSSSTQDVSGVALRWSWGWKVGISMWNERKIRTTWGRFVASDTHNLSEMTIRISLHEFPH